MHTAYDLAWSAAQRTPSRLALVDDLTDRQLTYRELIDEVDAIAAGLQSLGVVAGSRFATVLPNRLEHCLIVLALERIGAVPALMNARLGPADIHSLIRAGTIQGAMTMPDPQMVTAVADALPANAPLLILSDQPIADLPAAPFNACRGNSNELPAAPNPAPEDLAFIFYTSGTTGLPKGVMLPHRTTLPRIVWLSAMAGVQYGELRTLGLAPLNHVIGFHGNFLITLAYNGTYFLMSQFDPASAIDAVAEHAISFVFTVPTFYHAMLNAPNYDPAKLTSLDQILYGGAAIQPALLDRLDGECESAIVHIYGTTETMCSLYNPRPVGRPSRLRPGLFSDVRVVAFGGDVEHAVTSEAEGELIVRIGADTMFAGYLDSPDATAAKVRDGWYQTGDVCRVRDDGDLELIGRVDDVIRSGGENVHPDEVEAVLSAHPAVEDAAVVGIADDYWGEMVVAYIVSNDEQPTVEALDEHCRADILARYKRPRAYIFVDSLPRSAANKLLRRVLRDSSEQKIPIRISD